MTHPGSMFARRWVLSSFLLIHLTSLLASSLPDVPTRPSAAPARSPERNALSRRLTPTLDWVALHLAASLTKAEQALAPLRSLSDTYLDTIGLGRGWWMFSNPSSDDQYLRIRYFVARPGDPVEDIVVEMVAPALYEGRLRGIAAFRVGHRDKAIDTSLEQFHRQLGPEAARMDDAQEALAPIARYFGRRFAAERLQSGERLTRVELWHGTAPNPDAAAPPEAYEQESARSTALLDAYLGDVSAQADRQPPLPLMSAQREGDVLWVLEFIQIY